MTRTQAIVFDMDGSFGRGEFLGRDIDYSQTVFFDVEASSNTS